MGSAMSHYAILRIAKHKTAQNLASSLKHNFREIPTHNANADITPNNGHFSREFATLVNRHYDCIDTTHKAMDWFNQRLAQIAANGKIRSNAVLAVEYLLTASPEWWAQSTSAQRNEWRKRTVDFLVQKHGAENIIAATYQVDETTPHISAFVIPEYQGKLNARHFFGGRKNLSELQTDYAAQVADLGLSRGIENSKATHKTIKQYYSEVNQVLNGNLPVQELYQEIHQKIRIPKKGIWENHDEYQHKIYNLVGQSVYEMLAPKYAYFPKVNTALKQKQRELAQLDKQKNDFLQQYRRQIDEEVLSRTQELSRNLNNARWENQKLFNEINGKNEMIAEQKQILTEQEWEIKRLSAEVAEQERIIAEHKQAFDDLFEKLKATQIELNRYKEKYEPQQKTFGMDF